MRVADFVQALWTAVTKGICFLLAVCLVNNPVYAVYTATALLFFKPFPAVADDFLDKAVEGSNLGDLLRKDYQPPTVDPANGQITLNNGLVSGKTLQQNELFQEMVPGSLDGIAASYGNDAAFSTEANKQLTELKSGGTQHAIAYQTLIGANTSMPDISNDPIWAVSDDVFSLTSPVMTDMFNGCTTVSTSSEEQCDIHVPDLKTCRKTLGLEPCKVTRDITFSPVVSFGEGDGRYVNCGPGCTYLYIGTIGNDYWSASCSVFTWTATFTLSRPDAITKVLVDNVQYDDHTRIFINDQLAYTGSTGWGGNCDLETNWVENPAADITDIFKNAAASGTVTIRQETQVGELGEGFARLKVIGAVDYNETLVDFPAGCRDRMFAAWPPFGASPSPWTSSGSVNDQASTAWWQCTDASFSRQVGNITLTPDEYGGILQPLLPDPPATPPAPICYLAITRMPGSVQLPCFTDLDGYTQCPTTVPGAASDGCTQIANNSQCAWLGEQCAPGGEDPATGKCKEFIETYDCGKPKTGACNQSNVSSKTICDSGIRCMGGECVDQAVESNTNFIKAAAALQMLNQIQQQKGCDVASGECELFTGEAMSCQMADLSFLGSVDCCNMPIHADWINYMQLAASSWELADASVELYAMEEFGLNSVTGQGAWHLVTQNTVLSTPFNTVYDGYTAVTGTFTEMFDEVVSTFTGDVAEEVGQTLTLEGIKQTVTQNLSSWVLNTFGQQAAEALFSYSTAPIVDQATGQVISEGVASGMSEMLSSIINVVGIIYAIYQIAKLIVQLIFACTEEEAKLNMLKDQRMCTRPDEIGTYCSASFLGACIARRQAYCCFSSPFARIFQQQARPQLSLPWGPAETPNCSGLTVNQIASLDFNQMDFSEWINMMKGANLLPADGASADAMFSRGIVTTSNLVGVPTENADQRAGKQFNGSNIDDIRQYFINNLQ